MVNMELMPEADHFVMLDVLNPVSGNEFDRSYPNVQIIYPSNENSYTDGNSSHPENRSAHSAKRKFLFAISLNVDDDN